MTQVPAHDLCHLVDLVLGDAAIRQLAVDDLGELAVLVDLGQPPAITVGDKQTGGVRADVDACAAHEPSGSPPALAPSSRPPAGTLLPGRGRGTPAGNPAAGIIGACPSVRSRSAACGRPTPT